MALRSRESPCRTKIHVDHDGDDSYQPTRNTRPPTRASKRASNKVGKDNFDDLEGPLSVWAANNRIQPIDVADYATRSIEKRIADYDQNGYVKRNLNIFFLYKRAYNKVGQEWLARFRPDQPKTQPPLVALVGKSWKMETDEFKRSFEKYSELEKEGLKKAFPNYKYKPGAKKAHSKGQDDEGRVGAAFKPPNHPKDEYDANFMEPTQDVLGDIYDGMHYSDPTMLQSFEGSYITRDLNVPSMSVAHEPGPMITDRANTFLCPSRLGWRHDLDRSVSPAPSQLSYITADNIPIDPSLPDGGSDFLPSREVSGEPGFVVPSQLACSGFASAEPFIRTHGGMHNSGDWLSNPAMSRCASEEPWQAMPDAFLSSLPSDDLNNQVADQNYWHLEALEKHEPLQGFTWNHNDWEHEFSGDVAHL